MTITKENFFTTSDGLHLYFEQYGTGKPLLLIPGFSGTTHSYRRQIPAFAEKYRVIVMDPRGHGRSSKVAGNNRIVRMADDIKELIDHLALEDVVLMGHSLGGSQVAQYAHQHGEYKLRALGLIDATLYAFSDEPWNRHNANHYNVDGWLRRMTPYMLDPQGYADAARGKSQAKPDGEEDIPGLLLLPPWCGIEMHYDIYHTDNMTPLAERTVPVALFVTESEYHNAWESGHEAARRMSKSPYVELYEFYGGQHDLVGCEAEKFCSCVLDFMSQLEKRGF